MAATEGVKVEGTSRGPEIPLDEFEKFVTATDDLPEFSEESDTGFSPSDVTAPPTEVAEDTVVDDPFAQLLKSEFGQEEKDEDGEEKEEGLQVEEEAEPAGGRAQKRIRQLNEKAKQAKAEAEEIKSAALEMRAEFEGAWSKAQQQLQQQNQELQRLRAQIEAAKNRPRDDEPESDDPVERVKRKIARDLYEKEVAPLKGELEEWKRSQAEQKKQQEEQVRQQRLSQGAQILKQRTAEAIKGELLKGLETDPLDDVDKKFLSAAMLGFQANSVTPQEAAQKMRQIILKVSSAMMRGASKGKLAAVQNAAKLPTALKREPVSSVAVEPSTEDLKKAGLTRPQWKLMGSPPLNTI